MGYSSKEILKEIRSRVLILTSPVMSMFIASLICYAVDAEEGAKITLGTGIVVGAGALIYVIMRMKP